MLKYLGKFSGTVYDTKAEASEGNECCRCITVEQANDENFIKTQHLKDLLDCAVCAGCPRSQGK